VSRSSHNVLATRSGGSAIFGTLFLLILYFYVQSDQFFDFSILIPLGILFTVGLYDDIYKVDFKLKFIFQLIVAKIIVDQGIIIETLNGFAGIYEIPYMISQIITIFLIVFIVNATNFTDGIDGLAITETLKFLILIIVSSNGIGTGYTFVFLIISIALIPLYYFNFKRDNKVFLGDSGSLFLGGVVSIGLVLVVNNAGSDAGINISTPILILLCYIYPIIDTIFVVTKRLLSSNSPFIADKSHIHHMLILKGYTHIQSLLIITGTTGIIQLILLRYITS
jgi:UDP-N-acetylmuramyl pentapeptide phosphotransferase/UDP-N-acetylglucosamine-1-phosphate transferase